jgi:hypothetical protein
MNRAQAKKYHQEKIAKLMAMTRVNDGTQFHILDEATMHVIDHFNPPGGQRYSRDHCLIVGAAYLGDDLEKDNVTINAAAFFTAGDLHELSHSLAEAMRADKAFAHCMFHALEVFALHEPPTNKVNP